MMKEICTKNETIKCIGWKHAESHARSGASGTSGASGPLAHQKTLVKWLALFGQNEAPFASLCLVTLLCLLTCQRHQNESSWL